MCKRASNRTINEQLQWSLNYTWQKRYCHLRNGSCTCFSFLMIPTLSTSYRLRVYSTIHVYILVLTTWQLIFCVSCCTVLYTILVKKLLMSLKCEALNTVLSLKLLKLNFRTSLLGKVKRLDKHLKVFV